MKKVLLIFAALFTVAAGHAQHLTQAQKVKHIDSLLTYLAQQQRFMGSICLRENNRTILNKAYGMMGQKNGKPQHATAGTLYRIGSISKTYTATMILQLQEEGKLSLDDKLSRYFKDIPNAGKISLRQLLEHQSGLYNYTDAEEWHATYTPVTQAQMLATFARQEPIFEPGARTEYCNTNYMLLGYIIEQVTGRSFNDNLQARLCKKQGFRHTLMPQGPAVAAKNEAVSFNLENGQWVPQPEIHVSTAAGAGGIIATAEDVNMFYEALLQGRLLQPATLQQMLPVPGKNNITPINSYGYGIHTVNFGNKHRGYGHSGHIDAFSTMTGYFPGDKLSFSLFDNGVVMSLNEVAIALLSILFDEPYTFPDFTTAAVAATDLEGLAGIYTSKALPIEIKVTSHGDKLWAQATGQDSFALVALGRDKFEYKEADITMTFRRDDQDKAQQLSMKQGGEAIPFGRKDDTAAAPEKVMVADNLLRSYEGVYGAATFPLKITIRKRGQGIEGQGTGQPAFPLEAVSDSEFRFEPAGLRIAFKKDAQGNTTGMILTQGESHELSKE